MYVRALLSHLKYLTIFYDTRYKLVPFDSNILQLILPKYQNHKLVISCRQQRHLVWDHEIKEGN